MPQYQKSTVESAHQGYSEDGNADFLRRIHTAGSVQIPAELFEQLYLAPQNRVKGQLRQTFGNPTPIALGAFLMCSTSLSMTLLGWQGAGGLGAANLYATRSINVSSSDPFLEGGICMSVGLLNFLEQLASGY